MKRNEYNQSILENCLDKLQSSDGSNTYEGVVLAAYLIEQALKTKIRKTNPLLYFDPKELDKNSGKMVSIALGTISHEKLYNIKTITATRCIELICECDEKLKEHKSTLEELFKIRNFIVHSIDDTEAMNSDSATVIALKSLRACKSHIDSLFGTTTASLFISSEEFKQLYDKEQRKKFKELSNKIKKHKIIFDKLTKLQISLKIQHNWPKENIYLSNETLITCPACKQLSCDKIVDVDFDGADGEAIPFAVSYYRCRVCGLELSEYDYEELSSYNKT